jgi:putative ABC transport system substrate-binding protein
MTPEMERRTFLEMTASGLLAAPRAARAQSADRVYRIGLLEVTDAGLNAANLDAFRRALGDLGYIEGQHFALEYRSADGRAERLPDLAAELVQLRVDLIVARGYPAALAATRYTGTIPIVMVASGDPSAGSGILTGLARKGGNVTGLHAYAPPEVGGRRLRLLKEVVPGLARVGVLWASGDLHVLEVVRETETAARALGVQTASFEVSRPESLERVFEAALLARQIDALITVEDYVTVTHRAQIVDFATTSRLPAIYGLREFVDAGGLLAYGTDRRDLFRRSATYVDRIFKGTNPGDLPVQGPAKLELVINMKAARTLRLTMPASVLARADQVIQ